MLLRDCLVADFERMELVHAHVLVRNGLIAGVFVQPEPPRTEKDEEVMDLDGACLSPGFCDGHLHVESSRLSLEEFARCVVPRGTTTVFVDPHELANVLGIQGVTYFLEAAERLPLDVFVGVPSCVPATPLETAGGEISLADVRALLGHERVYGLAEMMNFPGIINGLGDARAKVEAALEAGKVVDGHCPGLSGKALEAYITNGKNDGVVRIGSDHECTSYEEAREKYAAGMHIMLRCGSASRDMPLLLEGFAEEGIFSDRLLLVSDDVTARDLAERGHVDHLLGTAREILERAGGLSREKAFLHALKMCTFNTCRYFRVRGGEIRRGYPANIVVHPSPGDVRPRAVFHRGGKVYTEGGESPAAAAAPAGGYAGRVRVSDSPDISLRAPSPRPLCRVITARYGSLLTGEERVRLEAPEGTVLPAREAGIAKLCVIERHKGTGNVGVGFVKGLGIEKGAVASTVAHDSHNLIAAGYDDGLILRAVRLLRNCGGGLCVVTGTEETLLPLDIGGLMSSRPFEEVLRAEEALDAAARAVGCGGEVFALLSFLALPVIPELKLTDKGLVEVSSFRIVPVVVE